MAVAVLTDEQLGALLEKAAERGAQRALEETRASELTTEQAAQLLEIAPKTVRAMVKDGRLPFSRKVGREYRFRTKDVEETKRGGPVSAAARRTLASLGLG
jgi:excisionase family DNA binding protein